MNLRTILAACAALSCALTGAAVAEPAPAPPIDPGRYDTPWGAGEMRLIARDTAVLMLADGSVMWGSLGNGGREWNGRWVRAASSARSDRAHRPCSGPRGPVPSSFAVPSGAYWGRFSAHSVRSGTTRALALKWSPCAESPASSATGFDVVQSAPLRYTVSATPTAAVRSSEPYDGPCDAVRSRVATITPCNLDFARPIRVTLLESMQKPVTRITFTPLVDDAHAVAAAIRDNTVLPRHSDREIYQVLRGGKLHMRGSTTEVTPPATICQHDFWSVNIVDGNGTVHPGNGVITMSCGPGRLRREGPLDARVIAPLEAR